MKFIAIVMKLQVHKVQVYRQHNTRVKSIINVSQCLLVRQPDVTFLTIGPALPVCAHEALLVLHVSIYILIIHLCKCEKDV